MSRKEFESIVASAPREKLITIIVEKTEPLGVGATESVRVFAPENHVMQIVAMRIDGSLPAAGAVGTTKMYLMYEVAGMGGPNIDMGYIEMGPLRKVYLNRGTVFYSTDSGSVVNPTNLADKVNDIQFDDTVSFVLSYWNSTDKPLTETRRYYITAIAREIV